MPNQFNRQKVEDLTKKLESAKSAALIQYQGLNAADIANLRNQVKQSGGVLEVAKNSLISLSLGKIGIKLPETLTGPTAIAFCQTDEVNPLKEIDKINKEKDKTSFKYGLFDKKLLSLDELKKFLTLPSKTALVSQFIGDLTNPLYRLAYAMRFNQTRLVLALKAVADKK
ncbi:MAG: 50S ribosomal protein L10 [Candidatus Shapirobacteria bacterium]|jgi:large subunit ribosomal protein L10